MQMGKHWQALYNGELYHMFHADADFSIAVKSPIKAHNIWGVALVQHLQLPNDLVPDGWFNLQMDQLKHRTPQLHIHILIRHLMQIKSDDSNLHRIFKRGSKLSVKRGIICT